MDMRERLDAALGDRYRIEGEIGRGGMAVVYRAEDLRHHRQVAVKVMNPELAAAVGPDRFLREIEIAAGLSHPHILPLHDSGEIDGLLFYVMPFVKGESLRARLDREKQLPLEDALRITKEVADALAAAHREGVVHRDIKPGNILLEDGHAVVTDFGVARALSAVQETKLTETGLAVGTPGYMSPEQASGEEVDARSDVYALGCVLYEMLGGDPPFHASTPRAILARKLTEPVPSLQTVRDTVSPELEEIIERALARVPADRFRSAQAFEEALRGVGRLEAARPAPRSSRRLRRWPVMAAATAAVIAVGLLLTTRSIQGGLDFNERDQILIADLENNTGEEVFDRSLIHALTVAIDQSQYVNVFPRNRVGEVLSRMQVGGDPRIETGLALEIAVREDIKAVLVLAISQVGDAYLLSTSLFNPYTGEAVQSREARAAERDQVLQALDDLATGVREDLGESLRQIAQRGLPLPKATTSSLEALKFYADGAHAWTSSQWEEARNLWSRAVELDSGFAWAHASLGLAAGWLGTEAASQEHFRLALAHLDRVTEKERLWIQALSSDDRAAVEAYETYLRQYPDDRDGWYNLGNSLRNVGRVEDAMEAYQHALAIDSTQSWVHVNLAVGYDGLGRFQEAARHFETSFRLDSAGIRNWRGDVNRISGFVLVKLGDTLRARERFETLLVGDDGARANGLRSLALLEMYRGNHSAAIDLFREAVVLNQRTESPLSEYRNRMYLARAFRSKGMEEELQGELARGRALAEEGGWAPEWTVSLALHQLHAGEVEAAGAWLDRWIEAGVDEGGDSWLVELLRGEIALAQGNPTEAVAALELADQRNRLPNSLIQEALGRAYRANGQLDESVAAFREVLRLTHLGYEPQELWVLSHYRLARVLEELGRPQEARSYYEDFLELWGSGDEGLEGVADARERLSRLASGVGP